MMAADTRRPYRVARVTTVFVDSRAFFALLVADDSFRARAKTLFEQARPDSWQLVASYVVVATHALLLAGIRDRARALRALRAVHRQKGRTEVD